MEGKDFRIRGVGFRGPFVGRVTFNETTPRPLRENRILVVPPNIENHDVPPDFLAYLFLSGKEVPLHKALSVDAPIENPPAEGDVLRVDVPQERAHYLFRPQSGHNTFLLTERCNCSCVMCVQPPRMSDDAGILDEINAVIPLIDPQIETIGLSGGEPSLLKGDLVDLLRKLSSYLPRTEFHLLSNARLFRYLKFARDLVEAAPCRLTVGVPLNSDIPALHDEIVRSPGAFNETIRGILNLHRCGARVEIRIVLSRISVTRLVPLACFIHENLPFVQHVAFMGMESVGFAEKNISQLWIDPLEYASELRDAVKYLSAFHHDVSIFNLQLCIVDEAVRKFARRSISDWKVDYLPVCEACSMKSECSGFFGTDGLRASRGISPIQYL